jgi:septal ring factor EnvC (AmiA/AmiB activator)
LSAWSVYSTLRRITKGAFLVYKNLIAHEYLYTLLSVMAEPINHPMDSRRIEEGVLRLNDKLDIVLSQISDLRTEIVKVDYASASNQKDIVNVDKKLDKMEESKNEMQKKLDALEIDMVTLKTKITPMLLFLAVLLSAASSRVIEVFWPSHPAPHSQSTNTQPK